MISIPPARTNAIGTLTLSGNLQQDSSGRVEIEAFGKVVIGGNYVVGAVVFVILTRLRDKSPVYQGGKDHTNHRLATLVRQPALTVVTVLPSNRPPTGPGSVVEPVTRQLSRELQPHLDGPSRDSLLNWVVSVRRLRPDERRYFGPVPYLISVGRSGRAHGVPVCAPW